MLNAFKNLVKKALSKILDMRMSSIELSHYSTDKMSTLYLKMTKGFDKRQE
jgi:hypothetical protein